MVISEDLYRKLEEKARQYEAAKEEMKRRIRRNTNVATEKFGTVQNGLLEEVERRFSKNPFAELLARSYYSTDADAESLLARERIPENFGPDEEALSFLINDIDSFRKWEDRPSPFSFIPKGLTAKSVTRDSIALSWGEVNNCAYEVELRSASSMKINRLSERSEYAFYSLKPGTEYYIRVRAVVPHKSVKHMWCDPITVQTKSLYDSVWKRCPDNVYDRRKYRIDEKNPRIATKGTYDHDEYCTAIANAPIPTNTITTWSIKILKSNTNGGSIYIGVAPFDINQDDHNYKHGWYIDCYRSVLSFGPPHERDGKAYGTRKDKKGDGGYVKTGDSVGVVMDTTKGELSYVLNGVNRGVAYQGIPLDKPLVPCVLLRYEGDTVELVV